MGGGFKLENVVVVCLLMGWDLSIFVYSWRFNTVEVVVVVGGGDSI